MIETHRDRRGVVLRRRAATISLVVVFFLVSTLLLPLLLTVAAAADLVRWLLRRTPFVLVRAVLFGWIYLFVELLALSALAATWVASGFGRFRQTELDLTYRLQYWWAGLLFGAFRRVFSLDLEVEDDGVVKPGPVIVMMRHASMIDTALPNVLVSRRNGIKLRYVLKQELLVDPAIDVAGHRLVNHFVDRRSGDSAAETERVRRLSEGLGDDEGVLIYPEGTRFTAAKRERVLTRLAERDPQLAARARAFRHVLPPRLGGPVALLDPLTPADIVFAAHVGLDGLASLKALLDGSVVGGSVRVRFWRVSRSEIPSDPEGKAAWLLDQWQRVDDWIDERLRS